MIPQAGHSLLTLGICTQDTNFFNHPSSSPWTLDSLTSIPPYGLLFPDFLRLDEVSLLCPASVPCCPSYHSTFYIIVKLKWPVAAVSPTASRSQLLDLRRLIFSIYHQVHHLNNRCSKNVVDYTWATILEDHKLPCPHDINCSLGSHNKGVSHRN